jgi:hypothetical protein
MVKRSFPSAALAAAFGAVLLASPALAQDAGPQAGEAQASETPGPAKIALAREIVANGFPEDMREEMFFASVDQMTTQMREATLKSMPVEDAGALEVLDGWLADYIAQSKEVLRGYIPRMMEGLTLSYATMFTERELADIAAFASTPSGQRFMVLSSAVMAEPNFASANQAYIDEIQAGLPAAMQDLQGRLVDYMSQKKEGAGETAS